MARGLEQMAIKRGWDSVHKDWYSIYQWDRTCGTTYTEWIAEWIAESFETIILATDGLREKDFKVESHRGQADLQTHIRQLTEKRIIRAIYNLGEMPILGRILDYEVPLKATRDAKHGNIDLLCLDREALLCVETKQPRSDESILKPILQAFTYTSLTAIRRDQFVTEFRLPTTVLLTPAILTFAGTASGHQLQQWHEYPRLGKLVRKLNTQLTKSGAGEIRFFIIDNEKSQVESCLMTVAQPIGDTKVIFGDGFKPNVVEVFLT